MATLQKPDNFYTFRLDWPFGWPFMQVIICTALALIIPYFVQAGARTLKLRPRPTECLAVFGMREDSGAHTSVLFDTRQAQDDLRGN